MIQDPGNVVRLWVPRITDAGLENLKGLNQLTEIDLLKTRVTDEGVNKLQQALPHCQIIH